MPETNKQNSKSIVIEIGGDNAGIMAALDEVEKKVDRIQEKVNQLKATFSESHISADA